MSVGNYAPLEIVENCIAIISEITDEQAKKIDDFCKISQSRYMDFESFREAFKMVRSNESAMELTRSEYEAACVSVLTTILFIQDSIDGFERICVD